MNIRNRLVLSIAGACFLVILIIEEFAPANVVGAYGYVLPILLVAILRNRMLMLATVLACVVATYAGLLQPTKPGRFQAALINRSVVVGVLLIVAYFGMSWEERKAREEAARAALAKEKENLLRANAQLAEVKDQLNRSERLAAVGQMVASVAHEVGTPLHSIAWHVQALGEEPAVTPDMKQRIEVIDGQLNRVVRIIQDLLSSTRQRKPDPTWLPVDQVVTPVVALMEPAFQAKGVALRVDPATPVPMAWVDAEKMHQVLVNLLANALAATAEQGAVTVRIGSRAVLPEEADAGARATQAPLELMVTIAVSDTGCGIPDADLEKVFTPFFTTKAIGTGTGLGLFLSREIVDGHGGTLTLQSEVGKGTTVTVALPGRAAAAVA
mgnify:CR=1 FL=1